LTEKLKKPRGQGEPERMWDVRWRGFYETKERKVAVGILVNCFVEWSVGTVCNLLLLINVVIDLDSGAPFAS